MKKIFKSLMMVVTLSSIGLVGNSVSAFEKPQMLKPCSQCHEVDANQIRGRVQSLSNKAKTLQLFTGASPWQLTFNDNTELDGAPAFNKIGNNKEVLVTFSKKGNTLVADSIQVKPPASIPQKWILDVAAVTKLLEKTPEEGNYALYDARPGKLYHEAHLAGAISNYDAQFEKNLGKLPKDKNKLVVFYCGGAT